MEDSREQIITSVPNYSVVQFPAFLQTLIDGKIAEINNDNAINDAINDCIKVFRGLKTTPRCLDQFYAKDLITIGYVINYLPIYFPQIYFIFQFLIKYTKFLDILKTKATIPIKILDLGCGPGTSSLGCINFLTLLERALHVQFQYNIYLLDQVERFIEIAKKIYAIHPNKEHISITPIQQTVNLDNLQLPSHLSQFDIVFLSHFFVENTPNQDRIFRTISYLKDRLNDQGIIVMNPVASNDIFRWFNSDYQTRLNLYKIAPCLGIEQKVVYGTSYAFIEPCGDLCRFVLGEINNPFQNRFKAMQGNRENSSLFLVLSNIDMRITPKYTGFSSIQSIAQRDHQKSIKKGDLVNVLGIYASQNIIRGNVTFYFCDGSGRFKIENMTQSQLKNEGVFIGDCVAFSNAVYDRTYPKKDKPYFEVVFTFDPKQSKIQKRLTL